MKGVATSHRDPSADIFDQGRQAQARARVAFAGRGFFVSVRRLQADGSWLGPEEAGMAMVDEDVLGGVGGLSAGRDKGANAVLYHLGSPHAGQAAELGMRCLVAVPYSDGESTDERRRRLDQLGELVRRVPGIDGVVPVPVGEAQGLDTVAFFAACRLACPSTHLVVDLEIFGHKLGQLCLSFGADEIMGTLLHQRSLRLGERASSNDLTADEAASLIRAAGFDPCERPSQGKVRAP